VSIPGELKQMAADFARSARAHLSQIEREMTEIDERKTQLMALRNAARGAAERSLNFQPTIGFDHQCPRCWVDYETRSALNPIPSQKSREDLFRCGQCGYDYSLKGP
jgi:hypothetical protein